MSDAPVSITSANGLNVRQQPTDWQFLQCFGERTPGEEIQEADIISAVEFDHTGQHLATGDKGGRVVLFERGSPQPKPVSQDHREPSRGPAYEYRYLTEFQSHEPEFDYLKSLEIEEKINKVRWCRGSNNRRLLLSANDKTIKLWKVYEKKVANLTDFNLGGPHTSWSTAAGLRLNGNVASLSSKIASLTEQKLMLPLRLPKVASTEHILAAKCRKTYSNAHTYHIHSISVSSDQETFISADDLRVNLWHLDITNQSFNVLDIKPANMEDLTEVITCAEFHPAHCHVFGYSSSRGCIRLSDMRHAALCDQHAKAFEHEEPQSDKNFFSEIISSVSDIKFSRDGRYILSRDFMHLKLWDLNMEREPVTTFAVHEVLRNKLCELYENDCIFDKFDCCISPRGDEVATGSYSNIFRVIGRDQPDKGLYLECTRDPARRKLPQSKGPRFGLHRPATKRPSTMNPIHDEASVANDFTTKLLHLAWHPEEDVIAAAASNSLFMFSKR